MDIDDAVDWHMIARKWEARAIRAEAALIHARTFLKTYQRSNAVWHNDRPTFDFIHTVLDPVIDGGRGFYSISSAIPPFPRCRE